MSTIDDLACAAEERDRVAALAEQARRARAERLIPCGRCAYCDGPVDGEALFCPPDPRWPDDSCARAHDRRAAARRRNGT